MDTPITKRCFKCLETKPLSEFYPHQRMADGHLNKCKSCQKAATKENYRRTGGNVQYERERSQRPERKQSALKYQKDRRARNPEKYKARTAVSNALRDGRLQRCPCEVCGTSDRVQAHHDDYSKPLEVRWLCFKHHREDAHDQTLRG